MSVHVIYEDEKILVLNKPSGLLVHGDGKRKETTLCDWILEHYPDVKDVGEDILLEDGGKIERPGIVHRLDKETSGVIVVAKTTESFLYLKKLFQERLVTKKYSAIVYGDVKDTVGVIDKSIGRNKKDFRLRSVRNTSRGVMREAQTEYRVRERISKFSFVDVYPRTGRTHQIRVHLESIGHPVLCDRLYAPERECPEGLGRLALHAESLSFEGHDGKQVVFQAPLPESFSAFRESLLSKL